MPDSEYLTVAQFAAAAGVSRQAIYSAMSGSLSDSVVLIDGKKYLIKSALLAYSSGIERLEAQADNDAGSSTGAAEIASVKMQRSERENAVNKVDKQLDKLTNSLTSSLTNQVNKLTNEVDSLKARISELQTLLEDEKAARRADAERYAKDITEVNNTALSMLTEQAAQHEQTLRELTAQASAERERFQQQLEAERAARTSDNERNAQQITGMIEALEQAQALQHESHTITAAAITEPTTEKRSFWARLFCK